MTLITCPDCHQSVSSAAPACVHCGRPMAAPATLPTTRLELPLFPVATHKFIVLSLCTLNFYILYWCYKNWVRIRGRSREQLSPFWRAFFSPFWVFSLFRRIREQARERDLTVRWSAGVLGTAYLLLYCAGTLPQAWWLLSFASIVPFIPVVESVRQINVLAPAEEPANESYSGANIATILFGGLILLLVAVGAFLPEETADVLPNSTGWTSIAEQPHPMVVLSNPADPASI